jgi:Icc-related predicted phosphoesterase
VVAFLRILILADIHGNIKATKKAINVIENQNLNIDLILIAGDLPVTTPLKLMIKYIILYRKFIKNNYTKWVYKGKGRPRFVRYQIASAKEILTLLASFGAPIVYVPGNVDSFEVQQVYKTWSNSEVHFLDGNDVKLGPLHIVGFGGSLFSSKRSKEALCDMEFYPKEFSYRLKQFYMNIDKKQTSDFTILITHEPPAFKYNLARCGSNSITELIHHLNPNLAIFGHYHEFPLIKRRKQTILLNPGPLTCYYFALAEVKNNRLHVSMKRMNPIKFDIKYLIYRSRISPVIQNQIIDFK